MNEIQNLSTITDFLGFLGSRAALSVVVVPWANSGNNTRNFYYKELKFSNDEFANRKITRNYKSYLVLKYVPRRDENVPEKDIPTIILHSGTLEMMRFIVLPKLEGIFYKYNDIFEVRRKKLYVNNPDNLYTIKFDVSKDTMLILEPSIYVNFNDETNPCIDMYLNSTTYKTSMSFTDVMRFIRLIRLFDLDAYAASVVPPLPALPIGTNMVQINALQFERNDLRSPFSIKGNTCIKKGEQ